MTTDNDNWTWWVGHDDERYHTECADREEAVYIASEEQDGGHIIEAQKPEIQISRFFDAHMFIERAEDDAYDEHGDPEGDFQIFHIDAEQISDLGKMVRAALDAWQEKHGLTFTGFRFAASRNGEYIPPKPES